MHGELQTVSYAGLSIAILMTVPILLIQYYWRQRPGNSLYALLRMLLQLLLVGYGLLYLFNADHYLIVLLVLLLMVLASSWIALGSAPQQRHRLFLQASIAIGVCGSAVLLIVTQAVLNIKPWYEPRYMIPLAGMIFANAMNCVSLAAERLQAELQQRTDYSHARQAAFHAAMIPTINALLAVGIVSLPGMMTGQILSGVSPLIAAKYQIVVMCMIFSSAGLSTAYFLWHARI